MYITKTNTAVRKIARFPKKKKAISELYWTSHLHFHCKCFQYYTENNPILTALCIFLNTKKMLQNDHSIFSAFHPKKSNILVIVKTLII